MNSLFIMDFIKNCQFFLFRGAVRAVDCIMHNEVITFVKKLTISRNLSVVHYVARNFTCDVIWLKGRKTSMKMHTNSLWNMKELTNHSVVSNFKRISICRWVWRSMKEQNMVILKMHERTLNSEKPSYCSKCDQYICLPLRERVKKELTRWENFQWF